MAYTLKTTGIAASYSLSSVLVVNEAGTSVQDLVAANTISVHANVTYGSATWRGTSRPFFRPTGSGFVPQTVTWTGTKPGWQSGVGSGAWLLAVINGWASAGAGSENLTLLNSNSASQSWNCRLVGGAGGNKLTQGRYGGLFYQSADDNLGDVQSAYYFRGAPSGTIGTRYRTAAGTFSTEHTGTDSGFGISDALLTSVAGNGESWSELEYFCLVVGYGTLPTATDLDAMADDWFGTFVDTGGGGGGLSIPPRRKFQNRFRFLHNL